MDGMKAIKLIRENNPIKDIPIIVATGKMTSVENWRTALNIGANDYIRKLYDPIEIEACVNCSSYPPAASSQLPVALRDQFPLIIRNCFTNLINEGALAPPWSNPGMGT